VCIEYIRVSNLLGPSTTENKTTLGGEVGEEEKKDGDPMWTGDEQALEEELENFLSS
jgi:hypothetical protein